MTDLTREQIEAIPNGSLMDDLAKEHCALLLQVFGTTDPDAMSYSENGQPVRKIGEVNSPAKRASEVIAVLARQLLATLDALAEANAVLEAKETDLMNFVRWACDAPSLHQVQQRAHELLGKKDD